MSCQSDLITSKKTTHTAKKKYTYPNFCVWKNNEQSTKCHTKFFVLQAYMFVDIFHKFEFTTTATRRNQKQEQHSKNNQSKNISAQAWNETDVYSLPWWFWAAMGGGWGVEGVGILERFLWHWILVIRSYTERFWTTSLRHGRICFFILSVAMKTNNLQVCCVLVINALSAVVFECITSYSSSLPSLIY